MCVFVGYSFGIGVNHTCLLSRFVYPSQGPPIHWTGYREGQRIVGRLAYVEFIRKKNYMHRIVEHAKQQHTRAII